MKFTLTIETDNQAFVDFPVGSTREALDTVNMKMFFGQRSGIIKDVNGNTVGSWELVTE